MASKFLHTVPTGAVNHVGGTPGSIFGIAETTENRTTASLDNATFTAADIAIVKIPSDATVRIGAILGTALAAGTGNADIPTQTALDTGLVNPPTTTWDNVVFDGGAQNRLYNNGTTWLLTNGLSAGRVATVTITTAGSGYSTGTAQTTVLNQEGHGTGLTVDITSVNGSGGITGVSINNAGYGYRANTTDLPQTVNVELGSGTAVLTIATVVLPVIGSLSIGRSGNVMNNSNFVQVPVGRNALGLYLKQPTTGVIMRYNPNLASPFTYNSPTDTFNGSDFTLQVFTKDDEQIGTLTVPSGANATVTFTSLF